MLNPYPLMFVAFCTLVAWILGDWRFGAAIGLGLVLLVNLGE